MDLDGARAVLEDFGRFWATETGAAPRRELLAQLFDRVWIDGKRIVAVKPTIAFADLFVPGNENTAASEETTVLKGGSDGGRTVGLRTEELWCGHSVFCDLRHVS